MASREPRAPRPRRAATVGAVLLGLLAPWIRPAPAAAVVWPALSLVERATGLAHPVKVTNANDGTGDLFVVEQPGRIRIVRGGILLPAPFLDITDRVLSGGERGLLGLAFPPGYAAKQYFYVNYTRTPDGATVIARYRLDDNAAGTGDPSSEEVLLEIPQPFANHNGGDLAFGPDGFLYITTGDGGSGGDPQNNAQNPGSLLGKILRIDVESGAVPYSIPSSNPFAQAAGARGEIWALGLRNPWRFAFDRETGDLYIGDVGQNAFEEVNFQPGASAGGENYGWNILEGTHCFLGPSCDPSGTILPVAEYDHSLGCSITGGTVYRGQAYPPLQGIYLYADFCTGRIWGLTREAGAWANELLSTQPRSISSFGEDEAGNLYATDHSGALVEIVAGNAPPAPPALLFPADGQTELPSAVTFEWEPSVDPDGDPVTYRFFLDTDPSFSGTRPVGLALRVGPLPDAEGLAPAAYDRLLVPALLLAGLFGMRRRLRTSLAAGLAAAFLMAAHAGCGGGSASAPFSSEGSAVTHTVADLVPDTTYHWKVAADDGTASAESATRSFRTAP